MEFPPNAFPDSILEITISEPTALVQSIYEDTTSAFQAFSLFNITRNAIHFEVENDPLNTRGITYNTTIPIPTDVVTQCPSSYGFEILTIVEQHGFTDSFPLFVLFESLYDPIAQTLTAQLTPEMFANRSADLLVSCSPGTNINFVRRRLLQNPDYGTECRAAEIQCPIGSGFCHSVNGFSRKYDGIDYAANQENIVAASSGVVERSTESVTYGQVVIIRHQDGSATVYGGLSSRVVVEGMHLNFETMKNLYFLIGSLFDVHLFLNNDSTPNLLHFCMAFQEMQYRQGTSSGSLEQHTYILSTFPMESCMPRRAGSIRQTVCHRIQ